MGTLTSWDITQPTLPVSKHIGRSRESAVDKLKDPLTLDLVAVLSQVYVDRVADDLRRGMTTWALQALERNRIGVQIRQAEARYRSLSP